MKRLVFRALRSALVRAARARPRARDLDGADRRVTILLTAAWGIGGTIRANLNLAGHLAEAGYEVEIVSIGRGRDEPFFGAFPAGVRVTALEDRRPGARMHPLQRLLRRRSSVLMHPEDRTAKGFNLWVDVRLVRLLRRRTGFLIGTRPGLNMVAALLAPPGMVLIGEEQMHLSHHVRGLRRAMRRSYPRLDALSVLTEADREAYAAHLDGRVRLAVLPNTAREMGGVRADLASTTALAAGRLSTQKGFDLLIAAWARIAGRHPEWRLRICGEGNQEEPLAALVAELGADTVDLAGPSRDMAGEMAAASVFVLSSRQEGLPLVLLEAMGAGMACVSFDCPTGPADLIDDGRSGLLAPPQDVDALAAAIERMIGDEELRRACAARATETAREYTMPVVGPRWEALLRELWAARG